MHGTAVSVCPNSVQNTHMQAVGHKGVLTSLSALHVSGWLTDSQKTFDNVYTVVENNVQPSGQQLSMHKAPG